MKNKLLHSIGPAIGILLFLVAILVLYHELQAVHYHQIVAELHKTSTYALILAVVFTMLNFLALGVYEILGFRYIRNSLPWRKVLLTSTIAFSLSNNVGFYSISGSAVRFRRYSQLGLSTLDITKLIAFSSGITFWLGLCAVCALVFLSEPLALPPALHLANGSARIIGAIFLLLVIGFAALTVIRKKPITIRSWEFNIPSLWLTLGLIGTACIDWILFGSVLYILLPMHQMSFWAFLGIFLLAQLIGLASHVPGGLGVFETVFILLYKDSPASVTMGALVLFRIIYYLLPLAFSALLLGTDELLQRRKHIHAVAGIIGQRGTGLVPYVFSLMTFLGGIVLLTSGATPAAHHRMHWITHVIPLPVLEISHFMASLFGVALLLLARGIYRRFDSAWHITLYLLAGGALFTFLKGIDYEEAAILTFMFLMLLPSRAQFYRKGSFVNDRFSAGWTIAVLMVIASSVWLGFFSYKHVTYSHELWWQFSFHSHASRFLRASVGASTLLLGFSLFKLLAPMRARIPATLTIDLDKIRNIVSTISTSSTAQLALLGDKKFLLNEAADAFIMYAVSGRCFIAMSDPIGNSQSFAPLIWQFKELCDRQEAWPVFYEIGQNYLPMYLDTGLTLLKIGEEARVDLQKFSLEGSSKKIFRYSIRHHLQEGLVFEIVPRDAVKPVLTELKAVSDDWLKEKSTREKRFSLGNFNEAYLAQTPFGVVRKNNEIIAFANVWPTATKAEVSIDLMRYSQAAPKGIMDFLFVSLLLWGKEQGYRWFNLGMAPFSGLNDHQLASMWNRFGAFLFKHGEDFYNFQGLHNYKEKFEPVWEPRYLAVPGGLKLPRILADLSALISGGLRGVFTK